MTRSQHAVPMVKIRWVSPIPPTLKGGGREVSMDGGVTWNPASQKEVDKLTNTKLVLWN